MKGRTRFPVHPGLYHKADNGDTGCQNRIAKTIHDRFIEAGENPGFIKYNSLVIAERSFGPGHPDDNFTILVDGIRFNHDRTGDDPGGCLGNTPDA
ncbi:hypothetical protein HYX70_02535 [Candidatus Saccharibacteria bacterium]|nr:hypothetical protein [Candidatus Saccharibacteria bacterium]